MKLHELKNVPGAVRRILREQTPAGGWAIYPGGPVDVSASVKAYLALKICGHAPDSEPMLRARTAIAAAGGPTKTSPAAAQASAKSAGSPFDAGKAV